MKRQKKHGMLLNQQSKMFKIKVIHRSQASGSIFRVVLVVFLVVVVVVFFFKLLLF